MEKKFILEVCVDSVESAIAAMEGGADRLELCSNLIIGGTTPSPKLFEEIKKYCAIPVNVLIRPRFGDFCYTNYEKSIIEEEVSMFQDLGANGIVAGCLLPDGSLDIDEMEMISDKAGAMEKTLHRAFDMCKNPIEVLENAVSLGMDTILTSGQRNSCMEGLNLLKQLREKAGGRIEIMAGSGVNSKNIRDIFENTGITCYHMSGKVVVDSRMKYRNKRINMGIEGFDEYKIFATSREEIEKAHSLILSI